MNRSAQIELVDAMRALRAEIERAMTEAEEQQLKFEAMDLKMEFRVGVTHSAEASGGLKFWVLELGGKGAISSETVQTVTLSLKPILADGRPVQITRQAAESPLAGGEGDRRREDETASGADRGEGRHSGT
jgi:Trypsin-co-occurring domain 2